MLDLWEAFNDVAEGFGLTIIEFREMLQCSLKEYLEFSEKRLVEVADIVFQTFDDDKVGHNGFAYGSPSSILNLRAQTAVHAVHVVQVCTLVCNNLHFCESLCSWGRI